MDAPALLSPTLGLPPEMFPDMNPLGFAVLATAIVRVALPRSTFPDKVMLLPPALALLKAKSPPTVNELVSVLPASLAANAPPLMVSGPVPKALLWLNWISP